MALRVIGVLEGERGEVDAAVAHCREAVDLAPAPHHRALATAYLALTLFEVGRTGEAISAGLEGSTQAERAGFESSFGAYLRAVAADGMIRTGRWDEAGPVLAGAAATRPMTIAAIRTDAARTVLAARRGDLDRAR